MISIREYLTEDSISPYVRWFNGLESRAAAKVATALYRMEQGNLSNLKPVGGGVHEYRIDYGPGYRIYLGRDGAHLIILLGGGTKKRQNEDIRQAQTLWREYKQGKKQEV